MMNKSELINKWQKEMEETHEWIVRETDDYKRLVFISRHTAISDILEDIKKLNTSLVSNNEVAVCKNCKYFKGDTYHDKMYCRDCRQKDRFLQTDC